MWETVSKKQCYSVVIAPGKPWGFRGHTIMSTSFISYENQICPHCFFLFFTISGNYYCDWNLNKSTPLPHKVWEIWKIWTSEWFKSNQTAKPFPDFCLVIPHDFLWTLLRKSRFFFNWPLDFSCSSIPLEIPCLSHSCHLFGFDFSWNSPLLLVCIHIVLGSHLKEVTTVLI